MIRYFMYRVSSDIPGTLVYNTAINTRYILQQYELYYFILVRMCIDRARQAKIIRKYWNKRGLREGRALLSTCFSNWFCCCLCLLLWPSFGYQTKQTHLYKSFVFIPIVSLLTRYSRMH